MRQKKPQPAKKPEGTEDLFGARMRAWLAMQDVARRVFGSWGFDPVETPTMEQMDVFVHGLGQTTDVVRKELFRAITSTNLERIIEAGGESALRASRRLALRPEGTAGFVRAAIEHTWVPQGASCVKAWYAAPMYRGERVQKGRLREFHQIGAECLGSDDPTLDAELIIMLMDFYRELGLRDTDVRLRLNSMGDGACRPAYRELVRTFLLENADELCEECVERAQTNPLRAFDCKKPGCRSVMAHAPASTDYLCEECASHFEAVKARLDEAHIVYEQDPTLVRGLDYYTRTVFEVEARDGMGSQAAIGGGGRYDALVELEGGRPTPGLGFAVGFERILLALEAKKSDFGLVEQPCVYVASVGREPRVADAIFRLSLALRRAGVRCERDYQDRSLKSQLKQADKRGALFCVMVGADECAMDCVTLRDMTTHEQSTVPCNALVDEIIERLDVDAPQKVSPLRSGSPSTQTTEPSAC